MAWRSPKPGSPLAILAGAWFAAALLALLALGLLLIGVLTYLKPWLEDEWHLTFPTPLPAAFWYAFAGVPVGILILYFLKLKRKAIHVPSTFLWKKSIEDLHVNSLLQWLRKNVLLILQLLCVLGLGYALADPTYNSEARGRHMILMIDNSASMAATDEKPTRLEHAKQLAHERVEALDPSDQAMVISFNTEAQILQSYTNRREELHAAIDRIAQTHRPTLFEQALALAEGQANPRRSSIEGATEQPPPGSGIAARSGGPAEGIATDVYVFSDGRFPDVAESSLGNLRMKLRPIGTGGNNVGIIRLHLRREEDRPDQFEVSVRVLNFGPRAANLSVLLEVFTKAGRVDRQSKPLTLAAASRTEVENPDGSKAVRQEPGGMNDVTAFTVKDPRLGYIKVSLRDGSSGQPWQDDFALDDVGWLAITPVRKARVLRVGQPDEILDAFLKASEAQQRLVVKALGAEFVNDPAYRDATQAETYDLVIFDRAAPPSMEQMPQANTLFIGAAPPLRPDLKLEPMRDLFIKEFRYAHPLFRGIETLQGMTIAEAQKLPKDALPARATALMETQKDPVLWALGRNRYTDLVMTFPLVTGAEGAWNTNWVKQPAGTLPLFLDNVFVQLGRYVEYEEPTKPGQPKTIDPGVPVTEAAVVRRDPPGGNAETVRRPAGRELVYGAPEQVGLYEASWGQNTSYQFAVNLFDRTESDIAPREDFKVGDEAVSKATEKVRAREELWPWFALATLALVLVEWYIYNRRIAI